MKSPNRYRPSIVLLLYIAILLVTASVSVITLFAAPPVTPYSPGETLTPTCAPGDANCTVAVPWSASGSTLYTNLAGNVGIGTSSPYAKLSVVGEVVGSYFTATSTTATSTFTGVRANCFSVDGTTCITGTGGGGVSSLNGLSSGTQTFSTSSDTNLGLTIVSSGSSHLYTPTWSGTLAPARGGLGGNFAAASGWLNVSAGSFTASTSPTVNWLVATSTTIASTLPKILTQSLAVGNSSADPDLELYPDGFGSVNLDIDDALYINAADAQIQMIAESNSQGPSMFLGNGSYGWSLFYQNTASISPDPSSLDGQDGDGANGGDIYVRAGDALSGNKLGGTLHLFGGSGYGTQVGGDVEVFAGSSVNGGTGGNVILHGGQGTLGNGAVVVTSKFGIGTTTPYAPLSVVGQAVASYFTATTSVASVLPYASSTALTVSGSTYLGSLNGPLQANAGLVSATTSIGVLYGGTGLTTAPSYGNLLVGNASGGYTLTATSSLKIALSDTVGILSTAKGGTGLDLSAGNGWLNVSAGTFSASTSPTVNWITATSTTATSTFPKLAFTSYLGTPFSANAVPFVTTGGILNQSINFTFDGSVLTAPTLSTDSLNLSLGESINLVDDSSYNLSATSDIGSYSPAFLSGSGALLKLPYNTTDDGFLVATDHGSLFELASDGSLAYLAGSTGIGTTSATAKLAVMGAGTGTGRAFVISDSNNSEKVTVLDNGNVGLGTTTPSALLSINNSGTARAIAVSRAGIENFSVLTDGTLRLGSFNGPLQANNGTVSATTSIGVLYGGTGLTSAPALGNLLVGNSSGGYTLTATSSLNIALSDTVGTLSVAKGGLGTSFASGNGWLSVSGGTFTASTSPTINWFTATSTTATSTIVGGLNVLRVLGVGTTTPDSRAQLHVYGGQIVVGDPNTVAGDYFVAGTGNTRVRINSSGEISADKYYDSANTSFYIDPRSGTNLAVNLAVTAAAAGDQLFNLVGHASQSGDYINVQKTGTTAGTLFTIESDGKTGIGTSTPMGTLSVGGTAYISGLSAAVNGDSALCLSSAKEIRVNSAATTCSVSSRRFKNNINDLNAGLPTIMALQPRTFQYNGSTEPRVGLIAEEVQDVDPRLVFFEEDGTTVRGVRYEDLVPVLAKGMQEQQVQIENLARLLANSGGGGNSLTVPTQAVSELIHTGSLIVDGVATFNGPIVVSNDTAGRVTIPSGQREATVTFTQVYPAQPLVNLTLRTPVRVGWYRVKNETPTGFQVEISDTQSQPVEFNWFVVGTNLPEPTTVETVPATPAPAPVVPVAPAAEVVPSTIETTPNPTSPVVEESAATMETTPPTVVEQTPVPAVTNPTNDETKPAD